MTPLAAAGLLLSIISSSCCMRLLMLSCVIRTTTSLSLTASTFLIRPTTTTISRCRISNSNKLGGMSDILMSSSSSIGGGGGGGGTSNMAPLFSTNPYLIQDDLPLFAMIQPKHLTPAIDTLLTKLDNDFTNLETKLMECTATGGGGGGGDDDHQQEGMMMMEYDTVVPELEKIQFPLGYAWGIASHLNAVQNGDEIRQAHEENQPKIVQAMNKVQQSEPVYKALVAIMDHWNQQEKVLHQDDSFEFSQRYRATEQSIKSMKLGGVGLQGNVKTRFNEIKIRLAQLAQTFSNNVLDETKAFSMTIEDPTIMDGVPESAKSMWANAHVKHIAATAGNTTEGTATQPLVMNAETGPWRITLDHPSYNAVMIHVKDRSIREKVYRAYTIRASESSSNTDKNNVPLIQEILQLRQEMAEILDFNNYAELSLSRKMAGTVDAVNELTDLIAEKSIPAAAREMNDLTNLAREKGGIEYSEEVLPKLQPWDVSFWLERLKESRYQLTEEETMPYFALPAVLNGMFTLVSRIFNIEVKAADGEAQIWHPDARFFKVYDIPTGEHIASFYLDPFSRPENKRGGAWMDVCIGKSSALNRNVPVAYLVCNGSPPVGEKPSLMTFREVKTLFHEFGHGLQHMLTRATVGDVAGINGIEWDAVELPSQFMENWCYDRKTVYGFAKHWETGESMPEEMFDKLLAQKNLGSGIATCRQLYFGQLDMELHANCKKLFEDGRTIFDLQKQIAARYVPHNMPLADDRFLCGFSHIFAGGYSAGYYSYKYAEVMSADCFAAFEEAGLENEAEIIRVGNLFRDTVLSLGGGKSPMEVFVGFRGRKPKPDALLWHEGLMTELKSSMEVLEVRS